MIMNIIHKPVAFIVRDFKVAASYRLQFALQFLGVFFSITVFYMLSRLIGQEKLVALEAYNGNYFSFLLIGIAFTDYFTVSAGAFANDIRGAQMVGTLESLLVTPTSITTILLSSYLYKLLYTSLRIGMYFLLGIFVFGVEFNFNNVFGLVTTFILTLLPFIGLGLMSASFIIVLKQGSPISYLVTTSSGLFGGVMYPVNVLPEWLQPVSNFIPITHGLEAMRRLLLNKATMPDIMPQLFNLSIFSSIFLAIGIYSIIVAVKIARKEGSLLHY